MTTTATRTTAVSHVRVIEAAAASSRRMLQQFSAAGHDLTFLSVRLL